MFEDWMRHCHDNPFETVGAPYHNHTLGLVEHSHITSVLDTNLAQQFVRYYL